MRRTFITVLLIAIVVAIVGITGCDLKNESTNTNNNYKADAYDEADTNKDRKISDAEQEAWNAKTE